jgi:hypothetical protein
MTREQADEQEDAAVSAIFTILKGWGELASFIPEGKTAEALRARLFENGIEFIIRRYENEWAEVDTKLKTIQAEGLDAQFDSLGMAPALKHLREAHAVYGAVLGTTAPLPESPSVGPARLALLDAIRLYAIRVIAHVEDGKPETQALADALLTPLEQWKATKARAKKSAAKPAEPQGGAAG